MAAGAADKEGAYEPRSKKRAPNTQEGAWQRENPALSNRRSGREVSLAGNRCWTRQTALPSRARCGGGRFVRDPSRKRPSSPSAPAWSWNADPRGTSCLRQRDPPPSAWAGSAPQVRRSNPRRCTAPGTAFVSTGTESGSRRHVKAVRLAQEPPFAGQRPEKRP